jgi:HAD superfamily hydrolase (TIGR01509 family)
LTTDPLAPLPCFMAPPAPSDIPRGDQVDAHRAGISVRPRRDARGQRVPARAGLEEALDSEGVELSVWRIHRKIGMSGGLFTNQLVRETGVDLSEDRLERLRRSHADAYLRMSAHIRPLPGARELLAWLTSAGLQWAIATSGRMETAAVNLQALGVDPERTPVVTRDQVKYAKPDPDLFLAAAARLSAPIETAVVVGDSIWDMLAAARCRALGVGLLCGGYGASELHEATAVRVYEDPADLLVHIDELGGRR